MKLIVDVAGLISITFVTLFYSFVFVALVLSSRFCLLLYLDTTQNERMGLNL